MKALSYILLVLSLLLMTGVVSAQYSGDIDSFPDQTATYGQDVTISLQCPDNECPQPSSSYGGGSPGMSLNIDGCTSLQPFGFAYRSSSSYMDVTYNIPSEYACGIGTHDMQVTFNGNVQAEAKLDVQAKNMDPHKGQYLYLVSDINNDNLRDFILSNDIWEDSISPFWGNKDNPEVDPCATQPGGDGCFNSALMVEEVDGLSGNEFASWNPKFGERITHTSTDNLDSIVNGSIYDGKPRYTGGLVGDGGCSNDPCAVGKADFTTGNNLDGTYGVWGQDLDSATAVNVQGNMMPQGEIIYGETPVYYDSSGNQFYDEPGQPTRKFFICREGATMANGFGDQVPQVVDVNKDYNEETLVQCQESSGEWDPVIECNDNLDNDRDRDIDNSDRSCQEGNNVENATVPPAGCEPGEVIVEGSGSLSETMKACYTTGGGTIQKQPYQDWDWTEFIGGALGTSTVMVYGPKDPQIKDCNRGTIPRPEGCLSSSEYDDHWSSDSTMPTVEYGAWPDYFVDLAQLQGKEEEFKNGNYALETDFVASNIGWVTQWQPLYTAERRYDADQTSFTGADPDGCNRCNDPDWWNEVNMSFVGSESVSTRYYDNSTALEHQDAWIVGNAGSEAVDGIASEPYAVGDSEDQVFSGGWIVECDDSKVEEGENNWRYSSDTGTWACEGLFSLNISIKGTTINDPVKVPGFSTTTYLPDTKPTSNGKREIGIIQFPYLNKDASNRPDYLPNEVSTYVEAAASNDITDQINEMEAKCWTGGLNQEPSTCNSDNGCFTDTASYSSTGPWGVVQEVSTDGRSGYACKWGYKTDKFNDANSNADAVVGDESSVTVHLHRHQNQGDNYNDFWQGITGQYQSIKKEYPAGELTGLLP